MELAQPVDWIGKHFVGYVMNSEFSTENTEPLSELTNEIEAEFKDSVFCMPATSLHITLLDWIAPLVDYGGQDKDNLYAKIQPSFDRAMTEIFATIKPIKVHFNQIKTSPSTIYVIGHDDGRFEEIRQQFLAKVESLPGTKLPPNIIHSSLARYTKPIHLSAVETFLSTKNIDISQTVSSFRLIRSTKEPTLEFELQKRYELG